MTNFIFAPSPNFGVSEHPFATWNNAFSEEEIQNIINSGEKRNPTSAFLDKGDENTSIRNSRTSWLNFSSDTAWLYEKLAYIARQLNGQFYKFDLYGFSEDMQYTVYDGSFEKSGHYTWHQDSGVGLNTDLPPRKLTMVVQLSGPDEYEGGDLQIMTGPKEETVEKCKGRVVIFPSYHMHRVTDVISGTRRSLVVWITGPAFR